MKHCIKVGRLEGLNYTLLLLESKSVLQRPPGYAAACDEMEVKLKAAIERTERDEEMYSTAVVQSECAKFPSGRKIIHITSQIDSVGTYLVLAICDDGTLWQMSGLYEGNIGWNQIPTPPA